MTARLRAGEGWASILAAAFPPGSVTGAPKHSALKTIGELEREARGPYCGAIGWVDGDRRVARLAVGIRTFWLERGLLRFGTGAGITWGSIRLASGRRLNSRRSGSSGWRAGGAERAEASPQGVGRPWAERESVGAENQRRCEDLSCA